MTKKSGRAKKFSLAGVALLKKLEGERLLAYRDSGGKQTIGVGHLLTKKEVASGVIDVLGVKINYKKNGISKDESIMILLNDIVFAESAVNDAVKVELLQNEFDALVCFVFNVGVNAFKESSLLKLLNAGAKGRVPEQLRRWVFDNGKRVDGLVNRRNAEITLWNSR